MMLKKFIISAIAAGALSVPLAGVALADKPDNPGDNGNGVGKGGVPALNGTTPGQTIRDLREEARDAGFKNLPEYLRSEESPFPGANSPGDVISDIARGELVPENGA